MPRYELEPSRSAASAASAQPAVVSWSVSATTSSPVPAASATTGRRLGAVGRRRSGCGGRCARGNPGPPRRLPRRRSPRRPPWVGRWLQPAETVRPYSRSKGVGSHACHAARTARAAAPRRCPARWRPQQARLRPSPRRRRKAPSTSTAHSGFSCPAATSCRLGEPLPTRSPGSSSSSAGEPGPRPHARLLGDKEQVGGEVVDVDDERVTTEQASTVANGPVCSSPACQRTPDASRPSDNGQGIHTGDLRALAELTAAASSDPTTARRRERRRRARGMPRRRSRGRAKAPLTAAPGQVRVRVTLDVVLRQRSGQGLGQSFGRRRTSTGAHAASGGTFAGSARGGQTPATRRREAPRPEPGTPRDGADRALRNGWSLRRGRVPVRTGAGALPLRTARRAAASRHARPRRPPRPSA